jgi:alkylhydroperoxidase family enzyme
MARLPYLDASELAAEDRPLLVRPVNLYRAMVNSPGMTRAFLGLANHIRHASALDGRLRELAILQMGWVARSPYEWSHHLAIGRDFGVTDADIAAIAVESRGEASGLEPAARAVLRAAREMAEGDLSTEGFAALEAHLDAACITDLLVIIAFYAGVVRFLAAARIEVEPDYQRHLDRFPLPPD